MTLAAHGKKALEVASELPLDSDADQHSPEHQRRGTRARRTKCPRLRGLHAKGNAWRRLGVSPNAKEQLLSSPAIIGEKATPKSPRKLKISRRGNNKRFVWLVSVGLWQTTPQRLCRLAGLDRNDPACFHFEWLRVHRPWMMKRL